MPTIHHSPKIVFGQMTEVRDCVKQSTKWLSNALSFKPRKPASVSLFLSLHKTQQALGLTFIPSSDLLYKQHSCLKRDRLCLMSKVVAVHNPHGWNTIRGNCKSRSVAKQQNFRFPKTTDELWVWAAEQKHELSNKLGYWKVTLLKKFISTQ